MPGDGGHLEAMWLLPFAAAVIFPKLTEQGDRAAYSSYQFHRRFQSYVSKEPKGSVGRGTSVGGAVRRFRRP